MRHIFLFGMLFAAFFSVFAQNKKERKIIKSYGIKSVTENVTEIVNGKEVTRKDSYTAYDKNANITVSEEYRKDAMLKHKETAKYDSNGNKIEETVFDASDNQPKMEKNSKRVCKYDLNDNKIEELEYDASGKFVHKMQFSYNSKGDKILEVTFDSAGKLIKKIVYIYDAKGLKIEKKEYDAANVLLSSRKYQYQF